MRSWLLGLAFWLAGVAPAAAHLEMKADPFRLEEQVEGATMDWTAMRLFAVGHGEPDRSEPNLVLARNGAMKEAETDALQKLTSAAVLLPVTDRENLGAFLRDRPQALLHLQKTLRQFRIVDTLIYSHGGVEILVEVSLLPILPRLLGMEERAPAKDSLPKGTRQSHTGLIVDTSGLVYYPLLVPRLLSEDGSKLYSMNILTSEVVAERGPVGYHVSLEAAKKDPRVGKKPLIVKALRLEGRDGLVLPSNETRSLRETGLNLSFLEEGRVILVVPKQRSF